MTLKNGDRCGDPEVPSTCEATSENEEPQEEMVEEEEEEVLSVDDSDEERVIVSGDTQASAERSPLAHGLDVKRGRLRKEWPKKDFELRPGGYAMMQRSLLTSQPPSKLGDGFTRGLCSGSAPVFRCPGGVSESGSYL